MIENNVESLRNQLTIARNEINKLRQQVKNLSHVQRKDIDDLSRLLRDFRCEGCRQNEENTKNSNDAINQELNGCDQTTARFRPIGVIKTSFPEKRAVPRQSSIGARLKGVIELNAEVFTNPEHSLDGLNEFSHLWIIYHFHKNNSHPKAKVAPPRLGGERVGVFSTRSPHRPCPIGLSLVEIDKIEGSTIVFSGTDMVDGTPVLDIKPYIPFYDAPNVIESGRHSVGEPTADFYNSRQEPDGEESELELNGAVALPNPPNFANHISPPPTAVKVPNWIVSGHRLSVLFNERAERQLHELQVRRQCIVDILEADPRSVYLRTKYGSQIFTFQLSEVTVTCKFDDKNSTVTVVQIRRTENVQDEST
ncbi:uncharacterized protein LOC129949658 [Eupeodes corollae]|uniref:uncharacterized protein LOC129949658 n=1 Tax=Eupeodes corollae TaxID=290404 RepID=UPI0024922C49|nr:uncharacterized protein LOC129949658 [Eupeodes corollae]